MGNTGPEKAVIGLSISIGKDTRGILKKWHITAASVLKQKEQRWGASDHFP